MNKKQRKKYLQMYYQRHNLPPIIKEIAMATKVNRKFYKSLRNRGLDHIQIMGMIQADRVIQFAKDVYPILDPKDRVTMNPTWFQKIINWLSGLYPTQPPIH